MTLFIKSKALNGQVEIIGDNQDPSYEVALPVGKIMELSYDRIKVDAWLAEHPGDPPIDAAQEQRDRSNVEGEGKVEPH